MTEIEQELIAKRFSRLERESRWAKRLAGLVLFGVCGILVAGQAQSPTVSKTLGAEEVSIVDSNGTVRIKMSPDEFNMVDSKGTMRLRIGIGNDGSGGLAISDADGKQRMVLAITKDRLPRIAFADENGHFQMVLELRPDGMPSLAFVDPVGAARVRLFGQANVNAYALQFEDVRGIARSSLGVGPFPFIRFFDGKGSVSWQQLGK